MNLKSTLENIVSYVKQITDPEEVILFGSVANGTANVYSDIDLLIITNSSVNKKEAASRIRNYSNGLSLKNDVLICTTTEFEKEIRIPNSFIKAIYKAGVIVYKKAEK